MKNLLLIGASGHAKVIIDIVENEGRHRIVGLIDQSHEIGANVLGYSILGREADLAVVVARYAVDGVIVAIGDNCVRAKVVAQVSVAWPDSSFVTAIHPKATISKGVSIGDGTVIMAGVTVSTCCTIGRFCILNANSSLDHDSVMEDFATLAPGVVTGGDCRIGAYTAVCIGATLKHGIQIGPHTVIGAGSTVLKNQGPLCVAYGTPAVEVRKRSAGDKYLG